MENFTALTQLFYSFSLRLKKLLKEKKKETIN